MSRVLSLDTPGSERESRAVERGRAQKDKGKSEPEEPGTSEKGRAAQPSVRAGKFKGLFH